MSISKTLAAFSLLFWTSMACSQVVTNTTELNTAISAATAGTTITLQDGTWTDVFIDVDKNGSAGSPITITAQTPGSVLMTGNSRVYLEGSYLTVSGLVFQNPASLVIDDGKIEPVIELKQCDHCKVLNNKIDSYNGTEAQKTMTFKWVLNDGQYNEIAYNSFIGKYGVGSIINDNRNSTDADYLSIHHNYFADRTPINDFNDDNDQDAIRIGNSGTSLDDSYTEVYDNYFYNFFGEVEIISNKSGQNKYYNNTFRDYSGSLTLRHGDNCEVYGNYFFAENNTFSAGVRVIGEGHKIYNNYIEGINSYKASGSLSNATGGINVSNGRLNSALNGYYQVKNAEVVNNTFVNCDFGLRIGTKVSSDLDEEPENLIVANNIMYNTSVNAYQIVTAPSGTSLSQGNLTSLALSDMADDGDFHRLVSGSSPIDAGLGTYTYLTEDILTGTRDANIDAGAEEFSATGSRLPYEAADVGISIGFGTSTFLPIELLDFQAHLVQDHVALTWQTATETNNDYFTIERSADGQSFSPIATIKGFGTTTETQAYRYADYNYLSGQSYYRLKQTDFDQSYSYGKIISVYSEEASIKPVRIFPNPSSDVLTIELDKKVPHTVEINCFDINGQVQETYTIESGRVSKNINIEHLANGNYFIQIKNGLNASMHKLTILHK